MLTQKFHPLDYRCGAVTHVDGIERSLAGVRWASHRQFEGIYSHSFRRNRSVKNELVPMQSNDSAKGFKMDFSLNWLGEGMNTMAKETYMMNSAVVARSGVKCTFSTLQPVMFGVERREERALDTIEGIMTTRDNKDTLQGDGYGVFVRLLRPYFVGGETDHTIARHQTFFMSMLAYI